MKCQACGADTPDQAAYCPKCGGRLDEGRNSGDGFGASSPAAEQRPEEREPAAETAAERLTAGPGQDRDEEEAELWRGGYSGKAMLGSWILAAVVTVLAAVACYYVSPKLLTPNHAVLALVVLLVLVWGGLGLCLAYRKLNVWYELTTQRFIHKLGLLRRVTDRIEVIDIDDVTFSQGIVQRMVGVGTICIISSDRSHPELFLHGIADVQRVAETIDDARRKERQRRGLHIETI